ncbi:HpcH/HpaI aldolase/citrate lyase family protein [Lutibaculum baratangense]|uniref:Citrate lyase beta chain n=1 Tax=Lutibaculum baratangense AMV1 TaxID=631454 RepID=V4QTC5_9HYPH|nr:CoA ester lyase [Lutibaculum baratangense]ESR22997.1 Citrate lyase beta chain [Lutibaculum baratangense AMV1]
MRSLLFVPGDSPKKLEKAAASGADALILDLEDSVSPERKSSARGAIAAFLAEAEAAGGWPKLFVRINALATGLADDDLDAVVAHRPAGIVLPKTEGARDVAKLAAALTERERAAGLAEGSVEVIALATETARGVLSLATLAEAGPRLTGVAWGGEDLSADIGAETNRSASGGYTEPYRLVRSLTLLAAAAAEAEAIDAVHTAYRDLDALAAECAEASRDGFVAKMAIHPAQVPVINEAFTPSRTSLDWARAVMDAFAASPGAGVVGVGGEMIDRPHLRRAERLLRRAPHGAQG